MLKINSCKCESLAEVRQIATQLDRAIEVSPLFFDVQGVRHQTNDWKGIYNVSKDTYCKTVSRDMYRLITHREFLETFAETLDRLNLPYSMSIKDSGSTIFTDVTFKNNKFELKKVGENFVTGIRIINSYDRTYPIVIMPNLIRLACSNGMILSHFETKFNVKHSSILAREIETLMETKVKNIINGYATFQNYVETSIADSIEWKIACKIMEKIIKQPKHLEEVLKILGIARIETIEKSVKTGKYVFVADKLTDKSKLTRWQLYNAITQYATHGQMLSPFVEMALQHEAEKLLYTPLLQIKV